MNGVLAAGEYRRPSRRTKFEASSLAGSGTGGRPRQSTTPIPTNTIPKAHQRQTRAAPAGLGGPLSFMLGVELDIGGNHGQWTINLKKRGSASPSANGPAKARMGRTSVET
jgi:hypothetical protein